MSLINIQNLTFCHEGSYDNIFENVSLKIDTDWKLGFTGRNGRGKTTFLNLLLGRYPFEGVISAGVNFDYFPFLPEDKEPHTLDALAKLTPEAREWELMRELSLLEVDADAWYRPFYTLSQGEQTKALLAALFLRENRFLLIDEPTNHLDAKARATVGKYLAGKRGFILVSHDRSFLDSCVDHILSVSKTGVEVQKGNFSTWMQNKALQDEFEMSENERLKKDIARLENASRRTARWSDKVEAGKNGTRVGGLKVDKGHVGHMSAKMMKRSKSLQNRRQSAIEEKSGLLKNIETADSLKIFPVRHHSDTLLRLEDACVRYGDVAACEGISFTVRQGERIALQGKNGSGKSSILKLIMTVADSGTACDERSYDRMCESFASSNGVMSGSFSYSGRVDIASKLKISYVSQDTSMLQGTLSDYAGNISVDETVFMTNLAKLDFSRTQFEKKIQDYSEGQKKKVLLAGSLSQNAHLYIWDEPLNYIDVLSRIQIEDLLLQYEPTMIFVEHDTAFTSAIATKTVSPG